MLPGIIVPQNHPKPEIFSALMTEFEPTLDGTLLHGRFDFSPEWQSYHDSRPVQCRSGIDLYLKHPEASVDPDTRTSPTSSPGLPSCNSQTLGDVLFKHVIGKLSSHPQWQHFRFLGRHIAAYITETISPETSLIPGTLSSGHRQLHGRCNPVNTAVDVLTRAFDYAQWRARHPTVLPTATKTSILNELVCFVDHEVVAWIDAMATCPGSFVLQSPVCFRALLGHSQRAHEVVSTDRRGATTQRWNISARTHARLVHTAQTNIRTVAIHTLPRHKQIEVMRWIFYNEDKVWRARGGRDKCETVEQFIGFLGLDVHDVSIQPPPKNAESSYSAAAKNYIAGSNGATTSTVHEAQAQARVMLYDSTESTKNDDKNSLASTSCSQHGDGPNPRGSNHTVPQGKACSATRDAAQDHHSAHGNTTHRAVLSKPIFPGVLLLLGGLNSDDIVPEFHIVGYAIGECVPADALRSTGDVADGHAPDESVVRKKQDAGTRADLNVVTSSGEAHGAASKDELVVGTSSGGSHGAASKDELVVSDRDGRLWADLADAPTSCYEIVTVYVHPNCRGLGLAMDMYMAIFEAAPSACTTVMFDVLTDTMGHLEQASTVMRVCSALGIFRALVLTQVPSYDVQVLP